MTFGKGDSGLTVLKHHSHRRTFVQDTQFALRTLLVRRISKYATVQKGTVRVSNHTANIPRAVRLARLVGRIFQRIEVLLHRFRPVQAITLVHAINGPRLRQPHIRMRQNELSQCIIHREPIDAPVLHRKNQLRTGPVHGKATSHKLRPRKKQLLLLALAILRQPKYAKDSPYTDTRIEIARTIDWIAYDCVPGFRVLVEDDTFLLLLGYQQTTFAGRPHSGDEEVIADDVELLLFVTRGIGGASEAGEVDEGGAPDVVGYGFEGKLEGVAEKAGKIGQSMGQLGLFSGANVREVSCSFLMLGLFLGQESS